jgi:hypothetical protein
LTEAAKDLDKELAVWTGKVVELRQKGFQDALNWPAGLNAEFFLLRNNLDTYDPHIPEGYHDRFDDLENSWNAMKTQYDQIITRKVGEFNTLFETIKLPALQVDEKKKNKP